MPEHAVHIQKNKKFTTNFGRHTQVKRKFRVGGGKITLTSVVKI
jgi:hypothetical protein